MLAGCGPVPSVALLPYTLARDGIDVTGTGLSVSFGRAEPGARQSMEKLAGPVVSQAAVPGCGTVVRHRDGLVVTYRDARFTGWARAGQRAGQSCP